MQIKYCACGCGAEVNRKWLRGHHNRIYPISKRPDIREKRRQYLTMAHAEGLRPAIWNKGLKGDRRCLESAQQATVTRSQNLEWKERASQSMRRNRQTLRGSQHPMWKGGTSDITHMMRGSTAFFKAWKRPILERCGFQCQVCEKDGSLQVHHDKIRFAQIIALYLPQDRRELSFEEKKHIQQNVIDYHVNNNISGIALCPQCHKQIHAQETRQKKETKHER